MTSFRYQPHWPPSLFVPRKIKAQSTSQGTYTIGSLKSAILKSYQVTESLGLYGKSKVVGFQSCSVVIQVYLVIPTGNTDGL